MTDIEHAKKYAEESISLAISMHNPKAEIIAKTACLYGLTFKNEQIAELERKLEQTEKDLADYQFNYPTIKELQKENADLKEEINKIAFARGNLEEENAELKKRNAELKGMYAHSARESETYKQFLELKEKENAELKDELKKWKDEWQEQVQKENDESYARTLQTIQLTKAKEIIKKYLSIGVGGKITQNYLDVTKEAEQFLSEVEK